MCTCVVGGGIVFVVVDVRLEEILRWVGLVVVGVWFVEEESKSGKEEVVMRFLALVRVGVEEDVGRGIVVEERDEGDEGIIDDDKAAEEEGEYGW